MNTVIKRICIFCFILNLSWINSVIAQQHLEKWRMDDYFPVGYFYDTADFSGQINNTHVGEMVFYMRMAGMPVLRDSLPPQGTTLLRLTLIPRNYHPLFVLVTERGGEASLQWWQANAMRGTVVFSTFFKWSDTGFYVNDATESEYHGNVWTPGVSSSGSRTLTAAERDSLLAAVQRADLPSCEHTTKCSTLDSKYLLEYRDGERYNASITECPHLPATRLAEMLTAMADSSYLDLHIHFLSRTFSPGDDSALDAFLAQALHYPPEGLEKLEECDVDVEFIVERDGSLNDIHAPYPDNVPRYFVDSAVAAVGRIARMEPLVKDGKVVRSERRVVIRFTLPDGIRPHYGHPTLATQQDSTRWRRIERLYFNVLSSHGSAEACCQLGMQYYKEYIGDDSQLLPGTADSALRWLYRAFDGDSLRLMDFFEMYLPILQLEQVLGLDHNPVCTAPPDSLLGLHIPATWFINWPKDGRFNPKHDYSFEGWKSYFWSDAFSRTLMDMGEPVLYDSTVAADVLRCSFYPSFHPALSFRVEGRTLYWCRLDFSIDEKTWEATFYPKRGQVKLSGRKLRRLRRLFDAVDLSKPRQILDVEVLDGAQWLIELRTPTDYKASYAILPGQRIKSLYDYLLELSGIDAPYARDY